MPADARVAGWHGSGGRRFRFGRERLEMTDGCERIVEFRPRKFRQYPDYRNSHVPWLGRIPTEWQLTKLKHVADVRPSSVDKNRQEGEIDIRFLGTDTVYNVNEIRNALNLEPASASKRETRKYSLQEGDIVLTKDSVVPTRIADVSIVAEPLDNVVCGYHLTMIRPHSSTVHSRYLFWYLGCSVVNAFFLAEARGTTIIGLGSIAVREASVLGPSISEQHAIASFLDRETAKIDGLVAKKERLIELLQEKRTALITHAVTQGLDPNVPMKDSGVEWLGEIPEHWEVKKWRYCCKIAEGQVTPDEREFHERILIAPNHVESGTGRILQLESAYAQGAISGKYLVAPGNIVYSKIRPALNKACIATGDWLCSADMYPISITESKLNKRFLLYFMLSTAFVRFMVDESMRVAMPKVNRDTLAGCSLLVPAPAEQLRLVAFLDRETARIDALIAKVQRAIDHLNEYRTALISAAVTGKIDVRQEAA